MKPHLRTARPKNARLARRAELTSPHTHTVVVVYVAIQRGIRVAWGVYHHNPGRTLSVRYAGPAHLDYLADTLDGYAQLKRHGVMVSVEDSGWMFDVSEWFGNRGSEGHPDQV